LDFEHIPAVRTAQSAQEIVSDLVDRELRELESNDEYTEALKRIEDLQQPILDHLSESIQNTLVQFLPKVVSVKVQIPQDRRYRALRRNCEIVIDDGSPTALEYKGDGVQSLAAIAIMRHASEHASGTRNTVIAIEEPESHLHPEAIYEIRDVISELSNKYQIVLTTHNPPFVDRLHIHRNIVIDQSHARPAKSIEEVRRILGVRASDNLRHANLVLIVEGEEDRISLRALLAHHSAAIRMAFDKTGLSWTCRGDPKIEWSCLMDRLVP
jgi:putative ATP-dependent endonuclease of the OLD family